MKFTVTQDQLNQLVDKADEATIAKVQCIVSSTNLYVTISKMGTSSLTFTLDNTQDPILVTLTKEDISFFHKGYVADFKKAIGGMVTSVGGTVIDLS